MVEDFIKIDAENREEILNFIFSFSGKILPSPVWDYLFPDSPFKGDYICIGLERYCRGIIEEVLGYWNILADKDDIFVEQMEFLDNHSKNNY